MVTKGEERARERERGRPSRRWSGEIRSCTGSGNGGIASLREMATACFRRFSSGIQLISPGVTHFKVKTGDHWGLGVIVFAGSQLGVSGLGSLEGSGRPPAASQQQQQHAACKPLAGR
ncbi:unnamed protein product [Lampetra fluviatilis]